MISSIIAPWRDIDPLILLFSIFTLATLSIVSSLAIFFDDSVFSIEGEEVASPFIISFSMVSFSIGGGGGSKKVAQKN